MPITYDDIKHKLQPPLDCAEIPDLRGRYFHNRLIVNYENTDFTGCVLYHCFPSGIANAFEVSPAKTRGDVDIKGANLAGAEFSYMRNGEFADADLQGVNLQGADLKESDFQGANLQGANLQGADLRHTILWSTDLTGANLRGAWIGAELYEGVNFTKAILSDLHFSYGNLFEANFEGADLRRTKFVEAELILANFSSADLRKADLKGANLRDAIYNFETNFSGSNITQEQKDSMTFVEDED